MATIKTGSGALVKIGTVLATPNGTQAEYEADTYVTIGNVESASEFGDERNKVTFAGLADSRVQKARGTADAGDMDVLYAHTTGDAGQVALAAAFAATSQATDEFNFLVQFNDQIATSPTKEYFRARVGSLRVQGVSNDGVIMVKATLWINTPKLEVDAA
jgi:2C-methyl-D-erythritol 2,4-cyclodiphosphate synthase